MSLQIKVFIAVFLMTIIMGPILIPILRKLKFGQTVRDDGPTSHLIKTGTPTIGGLIFLIPVITVGLLYSFFDSRILPLLFSTVGFGMIGFIDDYIKVIKRRKDGLYPKQKMLGLIVVAATFCIYTIYTNVGTDIVILFKGMDVTLNLGWYYIPFTMIVMLAITNSVNITDGLDGLATGITFFIAMFFVVVAMTRFEYEYVKIFSILIAAGCLGFLVYNMYPAKVFMGDTGSLALGGAIGAISVIMKMPLVLIIVGGIFVIETLSVILQVASFRIRGKRIFKMAPLHHHFELSGWKETKVVYMFWFITLGLCVLGLFSLRINIF